MGPYFKNNRDKYDVRNKIESEKNKGKNESHWEMQNGTEQNENNSTCDQGENCLYQQVTGDLVSTAQIKDLILDFVTHRRSREFSHARTEEEKHVNENGEADVHNRLLDYLCN